MTFDIWDTEGNADYIYALAGVDAGDLVSSVDVARRLFGPDGVRLVPRRAIRGDAVFAMVSGQPRIYIARDLPHTEVTHRVGHEIAEWLFRGVEDPRIERACDELGAALAVKRQSFAAAVRETGEDIPALAEAFVTTESCVALRLGEVTGRPMALVSPTSIRTRGEDFVWPDEGTLRRYARGANVPGIRSVRLTDHPRRYVILVNDVEQGL